MNCFYKMLVNPTDLKFRKRYIIALVLLGCGYLFFFLFPEVASRLTYCPFKTIYYIPCPACGTTRATLLMLQGHWSEALWTNPLALLTHLLILCSALWMLRDVIQGRETFLPAMKKQWKPIYLILLFLLLALNMSWNYYKGL